MLIKSVIFGHERKFIKKKKVFKHKFNSQLRSWHSLGDPWDTTRAELLTANIKKVRKAEGWEGKAFPGKVGMFCFPPFSLFHSTI